ncbi:MAG: hypothetical protein ACXWCM_13105 [Acidimicrobiales bacterium]
MDDLEARLGALLAARAADAPAPPPLSGAVRRRIGHRRRVRGGAAVGLVAVLLAGTAFGLAGTRPTDSSVTVADPAGDPATSTSCATGDAPAWVVDYVRREVQAYSPVDWQGTDPPAVASISPGVADAAAYVVRIDGVPFTDGRTGGSAPTDHVDVHLQLTGGAAPSSPTSFGGSWSTSDEALDDPVGTFSLAPPCLPPGPKAPSLDLPLFLCPPGGSPTTIDGSGISHPCATDVPGRSTTTTAG